MNSDGDGGTFECITPKSNYNLNKQGRIGGKVSYSYYNYISYSAF